MKPFVSCVSQLDLYSFIIAPFPHSLRSSALLAETLSAPLKATGMDVAAFSRATGEIYYIKEGGNEQIEGG
jgi:hypothetical protein